MVYLMVILGLLCRPQNKRYIIMEILYQLTYRDKIWNLDGYIFLATKTELWDGLLFFGNNGNIECALRLDEL